MTARPDTTNEDTYIASEHEPSDHYTMAQFIQQEAVKAVKGVEGWTTGLSAWFVWERYRSIKFVFETLRSHITPEQELEIKDEDAEQILKDLDEACIKYDGEPPVEYFGYYIRDYANVLIDGCKRCMTEREREIWEANS